MRDLTELLHVLTRFRGRRTYYEFRDRFYAFWLRAVYRHRDVTPEDALGDGGGGAGGVLPLGLRGDRQGAATPPLPGEEGDEGDGVSAERRQTGSA